MPRNGKLIRVTLALAAAALIGALAVTSATAANTRSHATLKGAGSSLIAPAVAVWRRSQVGSHGNRGAAAKIIKILSAERASGSLVDVSSTEWFCHSGETLKVLRPRIIQSRVGEGAFRMMLAFKLGSPRNHPAHRYVIPLLSARPV